MVYWVFFSVSTLIKNHRSTLTLNQASSGKGNSVLILGPSRKHISKSPLALPSSTSVQNPHPAMMRTDPDSLLPLISPPSYNCYHPLPPPPPSYRPHDPHPLPRSPKHDVDLEHCSPRSRPKPRRPRQCCCDLESCRISPSCLLGLVVVLAGFILIYVFIIKLHLDAKECQYQV